MLKQYKTMIILTLCMLTLVSVGFSSWIVTTPSATIDADGYLEADSIIDNNDFVGKPTVTAFKYNDVGFLTDDNILTNKGEIKIDYNINLTNCRSFFTESYDSLSFDVALKYANGFTSTYNIFKESMLVEYSIDSWVNKTVVTPNNTENNRCDSTIHIDSALSGSTTTLTLSIKYTFTINCGGYFNTKTYAQLLSDEDFKFAVSCIVRAYVKS